MSMIVHGLSDIYGENAPSKDTLLLLFKEEYGKKGNKCDTVVDDDDPDKLSFKRKCVPNLPYNMPPQIFVSFDKHCC